MSEPKQFRSGPGSPPSAAPEPAAAPVRRDGIPAKRMSAAGPPAGGATRGRSSEPARPGAAQPQPQTGKVIHDERGNAVWDWLKQTGRNAIESTTRLLRKLETPELKVEQPHEEELRIQPDAGNCAGGGYDPYNQPIKSRRTPGK